VVRGAVAVVVAVVVVVVVVAVAGVAKECEMGWGRTAV